MDSVFLSSVCSRPKGILFHAVIGSSIPAFVCLVFGIAFDCTVDSCREVGMGFCWVVGASTHVLLRTSPVSELGKTGNISKKLGLSRCNGAVVRWFLDSDAFQKTTLWDVECVLVLCASSLEGNDAMVVVGECHRAIVPIKSLVYGRVNRAGKQSNALEIVQ